MTTMLDDALTLLLTNQAEGALRSSATVLARAPSATLPLMITSRALGRVGRRRAASDGLASAVERAIASGDLLLALAAMEDLRAFGVDVAMWGDRVAAAFCRGGDGTRSTQTRASDDLDPPGTALSGSALATKATQIVYDAIDADGVGGAPLPLFGELSGPALRALIDTLDVLTVPAGHRVISEGEVGDAAYFVASGELEIVRLSSVANDWQPVSLARIADGALCGEMALLAQLPAAASVVALRPSILLVAHHDALERAALAHADLVPALTAHCRRHAVANLGRLAVMAAIPARERALLVERLQLRLFRRDEPLTRQGDEPAGLHLLVAGTAAVIGVEGTEKVAVETLAAGAAIGDAELVLCHRASADVIATTDLATLFLPRDEFFALAQEHPSIVHGMYAMAVQRHMRTRLALDSAEASVVDDDCLVEVIPPPPLPARMEAGAHSTNPEETALDDGAAEEATVIIAPSVRISTALPSRAMPTEPPVVPSPMPHAALEADAPTTPRLSAAMILSDTMRPASTTVPPAATHERGAPWSKVAFQGLAIAAIVAAVFSTRGQRTDTAPPAAAAAPLQAVPLPPPAPITTTARPAAPPPEGTAIPVAALTSAPTATNLTPTPARTHDSAPRPKSQSTGGPPLRAATSASAAVPPVAAAQARAASVDDFGGRE